MLTAIFGYGRGGFLIGCALFGVLEFKDGLRKFV